VSLNAPVLTHSVSTTFIEYKCQPPGRGGATTTAVQLNSIFSAKTDPRENPEKNPDQYRTILHHTTASHIIYYNTSLSSPLHFTKNFQNMFLSVETNWFGNRNGFQQI
jgi:hypothetical protein